MRILSLLLIILCGLNTFAQKKMSIEIDNPEPRVGEDVTFSLNADFLTDNLKEKFGSNIDLTRSTRINGMQSDNFDRVIIFNQVGINKVGPIEFNFNGEKYISNEIIVNVQPKLKLEEGLWIRVTNFDGKKYLIIEQLVKNIPRTEMNEFGEKTTYLNGSLPDNFEFASVNENFGKDIELFDKNTFSETLSPENSKKGDIGFTYSKERYQIKFHKDVKSEAILTEGYFINLPKKYKFAPIIVNQ